MSYLNKRNEIDSLQQKINSYGELSADVKKKINYKFRLDWNYYSNSMEGNTLTLEETRSVMVGNLTVGGKPLKDVLEIKGHDEVIGDILKIGKGELRLSEKRIKEIHKGIMYEEDKEKEKKIGVWKTEPNYVINYKGERFDFAAPADVPERMHMLLNDTNAAIDAIQQNKKNAPHPIDVALNFHLDYVLIHPFYDGNGRTARILTNLLLISVGYPPFWVRTNERNIYNQYIADIQGYGGKADLFFEFAAGLILRSQQLVLDAIEGKDIEDIDDIDKEISFWKRQLDVNKETAVQSRSDDQIAELFIKCLNILFIDYQNKMKTSFYDLFAKSRELGLVNKGNTNDAGLEYIIERVNRMINEFERSKGTRKATYERKDIEINSARLLIDMQGFKKDGTNTFNISTDLTVEFQDFKYVVKTNNQTMVEKLYSELINADERATIISNAIKETFEGIKRSMKNRPLSEL